MLFYPQKKLEKERVLLLRVFIRCLSVHLCLILALFIKDYFQRSTHVALTPHKGAHVSFGTRTNSSISNTLPPALAPQPPSIEPVLPDIKETPKTMEAPLLQEPPKKAQEPVPQVPLKVPQKAPVSEKKVQQSAQKKAPSATSPVLYTELKKGYSTLKKPAKNLSSTKPKIEPPLKKAPEPEKKILPEPAPVRKPEPIPPIKPQPTPASKIEPAPATQPTSIQRFSEDPLLPAQATSVTVDLENSTSPDRLTSTICQEISRYFRRPIGFDDYENLTISFEISNQKAHTISPRDSEPLVLYSAIKEALLKSTFSGIVVPIKVTLVYH